MARARAALDDALTLPKTLVVVAAVTLAMALVLFLVPSGRAAGLAANAGNLVMALAATALLARRTRDPSYGSIWRALAIAVGLFAAAEAYWLVVETLLGASIGALSPADGLYFAGYGFLAAAAVKAAPDQRRSLSGRIVLDFFVVFVSLSAIAWILFVREATLEADMVAAGLVAVAYPVLDLTLLGFILFMLRVARPVHQARVALFGLALVLWTGADSFYAVQATQQQFSSGLAMDALWVGGYAALGLAGVVRPPSRIHWTQGDGRRWVNAVYLPIVLLLPLTVFDYVHEGRLDGILFGHGILLFAVMIGRQVLYNHEVLRASRDLEHTARSLEEAQAMARVGSWRWDPHRDEPEWSEEMFHLFQRDKAQGPAPLEEALAMFTPASRVGLRSAIERVVEHGGSYEVDAEIARPDGRVRAVVSRGEAAMDEGGAVQYLQGTVQDVTELRRADERVRFQAHLLSSINEAVFANDVDGRILYWNRAAEHLFGWPAEEALGASVSALLGAEQTREPPLDRDNGGPRPERPSGDYRVRRKDGSNALVRMVTSPLLGDDGHLEGFIAICEDVGPEREVQRRYRDLVQNSPDGVLRTTPAGSLEFANPAAATTLGYSSARQLMDEVDAVTDLYVDPDDRRTLLDQLRSPHPAPMETRFRRRDGSEVWVEIRARLTVDPNGVEYIEGSFHDLTERRQAEAAESTRQEAAHLKKLDRTLRDFINAAAHDLNQPLTPMKLALATIQRRTEELPEKHRKSLDIIGRSVDRMALLVQDLLDVARLESGTLKYDPASMDLQGALDETALFFRQQAENRNVDFAIEADEGLTVYADYRRVMQVLFNLVGNAMKFTRPGGAITLRARKEDDHAHIEVTDTGAGLKEEQMARLFKPFSQVHQHLPDAPKGTGLGLYISKGIVEQHGGTMGVHSEGTGKGATFWFTLPQEAPEEDEKDEEAE